MHDWNDGVAAGAFDLHRVDDFDASFVEDLRNGKTVAVEEVRSDPRSCKPEALAIFERGSVAAYITVPLVKIHRLIGLWSVHKRHTHPWKKDEVALAREVAERTWEAGERVRVSQALRESERHLKFALTAGETGTWEMSLGTGEIGACDQTLAFLNFPPGKPVTFESVLERIHPEDLPAFQESFSSHNRDWSGLPAGVADETSGWFRPMAGNARGAAVCFWQAGDCGADSGYNQAGSAERGGRKGVQSQV